MTIKECSQKLKDTNLDISEVDHLLSTATNNLANFLEIELGTTKHLDNRGENKVIHNTELKCIRKEKNDLIKLKIKATLAIKKKTNNSHFTDLFILEKDIKKYFPSITDLKYPDSTNILNEIVEKIKNKIKILTKKANKKITNFKKENIK